MNTNYFTKFTVLVVGRHEIGPTNPEICESRAENGPFSSTTSLDYPRYLRLMRLC
jgi:hypothetical protein